MQYQEYELKASYVVTDDKERAVTIPVMEDPEKETKS